MIGNKCMISIDPGIDKTILTVSKQGTVEKIELGSKMFSDQALEVQEICRRLCGQYEVFISIDERGIGKGLVDYLNWRS